MRDVAFILSLLLLFTILDDGLRWSVNDDCHIFKIDNNLNIKLNSFKCNYNDKGEPIWK